MRMIDGRDFVAASGVHGVDDSAINVVRSDWINVIKHRTGGET